MACGFPRDAAAVLLIELDGLRDGMDEMAEDIIRICRANGVREVRVAKDEEERAALWRGRKGAFGSISRLAPNYMVADGTVPRTKLPEALRRVAEIGCRYDLRIASVFHAGDGNLHPLLLFDSRDPADREKVMAAGMEVLKVCADLGGTVSGEHGIGVEKLDGPAAGVHRERPAGPGLREGCLRSAEAWRTRASCCARPRARRPARRARPRRRCRPVSRHDRRSAASSRKRRSAPPTRPSSAEILAQANGDGAACYVAGGLDQTGLGHSPGRFDLLLEHGRPVRLLRRRPRQPDPLGGRRHDRGRGPRPGRSRGPDPAARPGPSRPGDHRRRGGHRRSGSPGGRLRRAAGRGARHPRHPGRRQRRQVRRADHEERHRLRHDQAVRRVVRDPGGDHRGHVPAPPALRHAGAGRSCRCPSLEEAKASVARVLTSYLQPLALEVVSADALPPDFASSAAKLPAGRARGRTPATAGAPAAAGRPLLLAGFGGHRAAVDRSIREVTEAHPGRAAAGTAGRGRRGALRASGRVGHAGADATSGRRQAAGSGARAAGQRPHQPGARRDPRGAGLRGARTGWPSATGPAPLAGGWTFCSRPRATAAARPARRRTAARSAPASRRCGPRRSAMGGSLFVTGGAALLPVRLRRLGRHRPGAGAHEAHQGALRPQGHPQSRPFRGGYLMSGQAARPARDRSGGLGRRRRQGRAAERRRRPRSSRRSTTTWSPAASAASASPRAPSSGPPGARPTWPGARWPCSATSSRTGPR